MARIAVVVGASGLIGRKLVNILLQWPEYDEIISLGRKKLQIKNNRFKQINVEFDHLELYAEHIHGDAVFCCLGTTKKKTPSKSDYRKIDHDYPMALAEIAKQNGIAQYHYVSSIGANKNSNVFYTRTKGETEDDLKSMGLKCLHIYRPSVLTGYRSDSRILEDIAIAIMAVINPILLGPLKKYRSIPAHIVALAMFKQSLKQQEGVFIHPSDKIRRLT